MIKLQEKNQCCLFLCFLSLLIVLSPAYPQAEYPDKTWDKVEKPEELGYSSKKLEEAKSFSKGLKTAAVVIVVDGVILKEWGKVEKKFMTHSVRKSFLSALYGIYVDKGIIDLDKSIADLGIKDDPPLSKMEKQATIRDCLKARSGVYHPALYESQGMKKLKPPRFSQIPGTFWYYNNWDFNVLGTIFEKRTGQKIFDAIEKDIAGPIHMEDYRAEDGWYVTGKASKHPAYPFRITARDMARFGLLMLRQGKWKDKQVIPEDWVKESTRYHSDATLYHSDGYGYMWWVARDHNKYSHMPNVDLEEGTFSARGAGGHYLMVIPDHHMVFVHRVNTDKRGHRVASEDVGRMLQMILNAKMKN